MLTKRHSGLERSVPAENRWRARIPKFRGPPMARNWSSDSKVTWQVDEQMGGESEDLASANVSQI